MKSGYSCVLNTCIYAVILNLVLPMIAKPFATSEEIKPPNGDASKLCVGAYKCDVSHVIYFFITKVLYIAFWTWLLNFLCKKGLKSLSWFLVLIPFLLFAVALAIFFYIVLTQKNRQNTSIKHE